MNTFYRSTRVEVSFDALRHNVEEFRRALPRSMKLLACVKANAYGHGAVEMTQELERLGIDYVSVAFLDEAIQLRRAGITTPILVLGYTPPEGVAAAWANDITINVFSEEVLREIEALASGPLDFAGGSDYAVYGEEPRRLKVHVKIDTGMGRLGLLPGEKAVRFIERINRLPQVNLEGMFTHCARADEADPEYTIEQHRKFRQMAEAVKERGIDIPILHTGNSAVSIERPEWSCDMVRIGVSLYGLYPSAEVNRERVALQPVLSLKSQLSYVKSLPPHSGISYGTMYFTEGEERIGTVPIGYADGYSRLLSGKAEMLIRGQRVPVVGTICMDQCMVRLDAVASDADESPLAAGEEVVLIGRQGAERIGAEELASHLGTINYEVICALAHRIPRVYMRGGETVHVSNPLLG